MITFKQFMEGDDIDDMESEFMSHRLSFIRRLKDNLTDVGDVIEQLAELNQFRNILSDSKELPGGATEWTMTFRAIGESLRMKQQYHDGEMKYGEYVDKVGDVNNTHFMEFMHELRVVFGNAHRKFKIITYVMQSEQEAYLKIRVYPVGGAAGA